MKTAKTILASLIFMFSLSVTAYAQSDPKVIAVVNKADWCHVCEENGERAMAALMKSNMDGQVQFLMNNLTNKETKTKSAEALAKEGLDKIMTSHRRTGVVYFFGADSKKLISKVSVAESDSKLAEALTQAKDSN